MGGASKMQLALLALLIFIGTFSFTSAQIEDYIDACGVPGGDGSSCRCYSLPHKGYELIEIEKILLEYEVDQALQNAVTVDKSLERSYSNVPNYATDDLSVLIDTLQTFNSDCYEGFYEYLVDFNKDLTMNL